MSERRGVQVRGHRAWGWGGGGVGWGWRSAWTGPHVLKALPCGIKKLSVPKSSLWSVEKSPIRAEGWFWSSGGALDSKP